MKKLIIIVLCLLVFLSITNPSKKSFNNYIESELKVNKNEGFFKNIGKGVKQFESNLTTQYYNKIFFSISKTSIGGENHEFLGIGGFWFEFNFN